MSNITLDWCLELTVLTDMTTSILTDTHPDSYKTITNMFCRAERENRLCRRRGRCVIAYESDTWKQVMKQSFGDDLGAEK